MCDLIATRKVGFENFQKTLICDLITAQKVEVQDFDKTLKSNIFNRKLRKSLIHSIGRFKQVLIGKKLRSTLRKVNPGFQLKTLISPKPQYLISLPRGSCLILLAPGPFPVRGVSFSSWRTVHKSYGLQNNPVDAWNFFSLPSAPSANFFASAIVFSQLRCQHGKQNTYIPVDLHVGHCRS